MTIYYKKLLPAILVSLFLILLLLHIYNYADYQTDLKPGTFIKNGASDLRVPLWSVPLVYDWDGDGKKDLLVGHNHRDQNGMNHGYISLFRNKGSDSAPAFNGFDYLQTCSNKCSILDAAAFG